MDPNKPLKIKRIVIVLGMHRSGTSAITRGLQVLGINLGDSLMLPADDNNTKGFWEDIHLNKLNIEMLHAIGSDWSHVGAIDQSDVEILHKQGYFLRAIELLRAKVSGSHIFAFKDPRVAKLLPFWKAVFEHCQLDVSYVLAVRHPLSVASSLNKRDGLITEQSYVLWLSYVISSLTYSAGKKRVLIDFDRLMISPDHELSRIAKCLELEVDLTELQEYKTDFLSEGLRHTFYEINDLLLDQACPPLVQEVYSALLEVASDNSNFDELNIKIAKWAKEFERLKSPLMLIDKLFVQKNAANQAVLERDGQIAYLNQVAAERDGQITNLNQAVLDRDGQITNLNQAVLDCDGQITNLNQAVLDRDSQLANLSAEQNQILNSTCWKITKPLRFLMRNFVYKPYLKLHHFISSSTRHVWLGLPLSTQHKQNLKNKLFNSLPLLFRGSHAFRSWAAVNTPWDKDSEIISNQSVSSAYETLTNPYVPLLYNLPPKDVPIRLIAFYLPQFHAIAENDQWWGKGFTEWSNVKPAQRQFAGHYQPHVPNELGYYNLLDSSTQLRQIELAKLYGVGGFCFYTYWFDGKLLLEKPIENYLSDSALDFPFCLCWANENWSRRWDGLDNDILMAQKHSSDDDLAFIKHVSQYMKDARYIRIDGKPLLLVYRPSLLPSAIETARRWRDWCLNNGIGEIYLAYTQSFETVDPKKYGFDAAIEFPPNNSAPLNITNTVKPLNADFSGIVYDWGVFVERSRNYSKPSYKLFRGVCPSWDNSARKKNKGTIFVNSNPRGYQEWLTNAITETCNTTSNLDERIVFINAWNEWAEGAHLEPDQRFGYAYLESTRLALIRSASILSEKYTEKNKVVAIVVHAFYEDVFIEILEYLKTITSIPIKIYVTTAKEKESEIRSLLVSQSFDYLLRVVENRGRDILPFLKIMKDVVEAQHDFFVKVHTKKSLHRTDGNEWRKDLYAKLISENALINSINFLRTNAKVGILCPNDHLVAMNYFYGSNEEKIARLTLRMGVELTLIPTLNFCAGSMFTARTESILPLLNLAISDSDFEDELGQVDGTFAHAVERIFAISAFSVQLSTRCLNDSKLKKYEYATS